MTFFDQTYFGNTLHTWAIALGTAIGTTILLSIVKRIVVHRLAILTQKTATDLDDLVVDLFMDIQQAINLAMVRRFRKEGISFAYPTRTLVVQQEREQVRAKRNLRRV